jgi:hypothetical protein
LRSSLVSAVIMARSCALICASRLLIVCFRASTETVCEDDDEDDDDDFEDLEDCFLEEDRAR